MIAYLPELVGAAAAVAWLFFVIAQARIRLREGCLVMRGGVLVKKRDQPGKFRLLFSVGLIAGLAGIFLSFLIFRSFARIIWP